MISKKDILDIAHKVTQVGGGGSFQVVSPMRDWLVGVAICLVMVTAGIAYDVIKFSYYNNIETIVKQNTTKEVKLDTDTVETVLQIYQDKQAEFDRLRAFGDPNAPRLQDTSDGSKTTNRSQDSGTRQVR